MKKVLILASAFLSFTAFAVSSPEKCSNQLATKAKGAKNYSDLEGQAGGVPALSGCKHVEGNFDGQKVNNDVYIGADKKAMIVHNLDTNVVSLSTFDGEIVDFAVMEGRLIVLSGDHRVIVVARNGNRYELLNSSNSSYKAVSKIKINPTTKELEMDQEGSGPVPPMSADKLTEKLNKTGQYKALSF